LQAVKQNMLNRLLMVGLLIGVVLTTIMASVPPVDRDALTHHLAVPKLYLKHGGMYEIPSVPFSYYPMNLDLLYAVPLAFGNDILPKYIHFGFALFTAGLIFLYLRRRLEDRFYALLGALLFLSLPVIVKLSVTVYVDLGLIFFSTASLLQLLRWSETNRRMRHMVLAGIFAGLCLGTKPNGLLAAFLLALTVPFLYSRPAWSGDRDTAAADFAPRETGTRGALTPVGWAVLFGAVAAAVYSPWMIRNYAWTGNPIYPLAQQLFSPAVPAVHESGAEGEEAMEAGANEAPRANGGSGFGYFGMRKLVFGESLSEILAIPVRIFFQGEDDNPRLFDGRLNPYLLIFPLLTLLVFKGRTRSARLAQEKRVMAMFSLLYLLFTFFLVDMRIRYIGPIIPPLVILTVIGIADIEDFCRLRFSGRNRTLGLAALGGIVLSLLGLNAVYVTRQFSVIDPWSYLSGELSRDEYIQKYRPEYAAITYANRHLPPEARILALFNGNRIYYSDREMICSPGLFRSMLIDNNSSEAVRDELEQEGISYVLVRVDLFNRWAASQFDEREKRILQALFQQHLQSLYQSHGYELFKVMDG
jgi:4-amino-4-deoxy-L-arabinose transferase-like glycosyltransferase